MKSLVRLTIVVLLSVSTPALAEEQSDAVKLPAGVVKVLRGSVSIDRGRQQYPAEVGSLVIAGDLVATGSDGSVGITLRDGTLLSTGPNSILILKEYSFDPMTQAGSMNAALNRGTLAVASGKIAKTSPEAVRLSTPVSILGVRGTEFVVEAGAGE